MNFVVNCDVCPDKVVGSYELLRPGETKEDGEDEPSVWESHHRIYWTTIETIGGRTLTEAEYKRDVSLFPRRDFAGLYAANWKYVVFWCRECDRCYCLDHWGIAHSDDDPMCSEFGHCPNGHGKILDD